MRDLKCPSVARYSRRANDLSAGVPVGRVLTVDQGVVRRDTEEKAGPGREGRSRRRGNRVNPVARAGVAANQVTGGAPADSQHHLPERCLPLHALPPSSALKPSVGFRYFPTLSDCRKRVW